MPEAIVATRLSVVQIQRFWSRVDRRAPDRCWPFTGPISDRGYGKFSASGSWRANRLALILSAGLPPTPQHLSCHTCDNPICCNPAHLFWGTHRENMIDSVRKGRHFMLRNKMSPEERRERRRVVSRASYYRRGGVPMHMRVGVRKGTAKLDDAKVVMIRQQYASGASLRGLGRAYGVTHSTILQIVQRKRWSHVS